MTAETSATPTRQSAVRVEPQGALPHLDTDRPAELGDELIRSVDGHASEDRGRRHLQAPVAAHRPGDLIVQGEAAAIEVEPPGALQVQSIRCRVRIAALFLDEGHGLARPHAVGRPLPPIRRQLGLLRIDRRDPFDTHQPHLATRLEHPHLLCVPHAVGIGQGERAHRAIVTGGQLDHPRPGPHLDPQVAVRLDAGRQWALQRHRNERGGKGLAEQQLTTGAGDVQLDAGDELQRNVVDHQAVHGDVEAVLLVLRWCMLLQPQPSLRVAIRKGDPLPANGQRHQAR